MRTPLQIFESIVLENEESMGCSREEAYRFSMLTNKAVYRAVQDAENERKNEALANEKAQQKAEKANLNRRLHNVSVWSVANPRVAFMCGLHTDASLSQINAEWPKVIDSLRVVPESDYPKSAKQAGTMFSDIVQQIQDREGMTYDKAWDTARVRHQELYAIMARK